MNMVHSADGTKIAYDKAGQGPSLILVTGAFSYRKFPGLVKLAELLSEHFTVYSYDRRGRGDSGNTLPYSVDKEIQDLNALIQTAGGSAYVWGLSSGAVLALQAAVSGANITKLALHEPPFVVDAGDPKPPADFLQHLNELIHTNQRAQAIKYFMTKGMGAPSFIVTLMRILPGVWSNLMAVAHTLPYDAALLAGYTEGKALPAEQWTSVTIPTLVLEGTESPASLRHASQALAQALPSARLVSRKGLGHTKKLPAAQTAEELAAFF
ncbi:alpha/beta fold hydrolase [Paenibacillus sp. GCM10023252]|uniref:alpha/beta fold hydrolase n=1 Tax=Paenibacillus sp. GCM10023252 TaxID=3252649 RepID=UPI0036122673